MKNTTGISIELNRTLKEVWQTVRELCHFCFWDSDVLRFEWDMAVIVHHIEKWFRMHKAYKPLKFLAAFPVTSSGYKPCIPTHFRTVIHHYPDGHPSDETSQQDDRFHYSLYVTDRGNRYFVMTHGGESSTWLLPPFNDPC
ncbi:MAG: hypothetical protein ABSH20_17285 [Tepidisphaeraceae bacterium]